MEAAYRAVENLFLWLGGLIYRHPVPALILVLAVTAALGSQLPGLRMDTSNEGFFHQNSLELSNYFAFKEEFGREDLIVIGVESDRLFDDAFLHRLKSLHEALEEQVPYLDEVTSLLNARNTRGEGDELIVEDLFEDWPTSDAAMAQLERRAGNNPIYRDLLLSADGRVTALVVRPSAYAIEDDGSDVLSGFDEAPQSTPSQPVFLDDKQAAEFVTATLAVVEQFSSADFELQVSGMPAMTETVKQLMRRDVARFLLIAVAAIAVLLYLMFRRLSGVLIPLLAVILTLVCTLGLMAMTGTAFKVPTQILPSFLIAVGVGSSVHILSQFYWRFDACGDRGEALTGALGHSGAPVLGAAVTTAGGLMSFSNATLAPLAEMGIFAGAGVLISLLYTIILIPALLALVPIKRKETASDSGSAMNRVLGHIAEFAIHYRRVNLLVLTLMALLALAGLSKLTFEHNPLEWFPRDHPLRVDTESLNESLNGVVSLELVIDSGEENGFYQPSRLQALEELGSRVADIEHRGLSSEKTLSLVDVIKEINQALNAGQPEYYRIPEDRALVAQELFLFENTGTDDLEDFVDSQFRKARYTVKIPWAGATVIDGYSEALLATAQKTLADDMSVSVTGVTSLFTAIVVQSLHSMQESYILAGLFISILMVLFVGDMKIGLIAMIPNLLPILIALGALGWSGVPMNVFTMFVGSIALGLAVDDTLHFLHGFKRYHLQCGDTEEAIRKTFVSTGRALLVTTVALSLGFFLFAFASLQSVVLFGLLTGASIVMAVVADFIVMPALLIWLFPNTEANLDTLEEADP